MSDTPKKFNEDDACIDFGDFVPAPCGSAIPAPSNNMFITKKAKVWVDEASKRPFPNSLWNNLWYKGEIGSLFADTNVGKSILAVQICNDIAKDEKVLYMDFELSDVQFTHRYSDDETGETFAFPENLYRVEFNPEAFIDDNNIAGVLDSIEMEAEKIGAKIIVIDNMTWLTSKSESGDTAAQLMSRLVQMKKRGGYSILVLAHTPKRNTNAPINQNSLAGSKRIANFMDSIFALGTSKKDRPSSRYIKQIKARSTEILYGEDNVIEGKIVKDGCYLHFEQTGFGTEAENLEEPNAQDIIRDECDEEIARRLKLGQTYKTIEREMGVNPRVIARVSHALKS